MIDERKDMADDPLMFALGMTRGENQVMHRYITQVMEEGNILENDATRRKERIMSSENTKPTTYRMINPHLSLHPIYSSDDIVDDDFRTAFTRMRLSSHRLRIETGRWARIPQDQRTCQCGIVYKRRNMYFVNATL